MKNTIFGAIIALIVCACIFSILCVTDVISFNKNNKVNNTDNNTQKDVKETKLCTTSKTLDNNEYKIAIYKVEDGEKNNKIDQFCIYPFRISGLFIRTFFKTLC